MPNVHSTLTELFSDIADSIRAKTGSNADIVADDFPDAIAEIPTGESTVSVTPKDVNFYDYDGTCLYAYSTDEFLDLEDLPDDPEHEGLESQGWNWTYENAIDYVEANKKLNIGQMYVTDDGKTRFYVSVEDSRPMVLNLGCSAVGGVTIDWGDNSTQDTTATAVTRYTHVYDSPGDYVITLQVTSGYLNLSGAYDSEGCIASRTVFSGQSYISVDNYTALFVDSYNSCRITKIELGSRITQLGWFAFENCTSLKSITIPSTVVRIGANAFSCNFSLVSVTLPESLTILGSAAFSQCKYLKSVSLPNNVDTRNTVVSYTDAYDNSGHAWFWGCSNLRYITLPSGLNFVTIGPNLFKYCSSILSITIPTNVNSIESYAFLASGIKEYHFISDTPPTLINNNSLAVYSGIIIYVPEGSLADYEDDTQFSRYSGYLQEE